MSELPVQIRLIKDKIGLKGDVVTNDDAIATVRHQPWAPSVITETEQPQQRLKDWAQISSSINTRFSQSYLMPQKNETDELQVCFIWTRNLSTVICRLISLWKWTLELVKSLRLRSWFLTRFSRRNSSSSSSSKMCSSSSVWINFWLLTAPPEFGFLRKLCQSLSTIHSKTYINQTKIICTLLNARNPGRS